MELQIEALFEKIVVMAMFSRRALQNAIDESLPYADRSKRREWVKILNSPTSVKYIPTEWELVILQSLATLGTVQHESDLGGETKPDLHFRSSTVTFVADIATISDRGSHERNPIGPFEKELRKRWQESGITEGGFAFHASTRLHTGRGSKPPVIMPPVEQFESLIFNDRFDQFVREVQAAPQEQRQLAVPWARESVIQITYVPGRRFVWCTGYTSYTVPTQRDRNPLYLALKEKGARRQKVTTAGLRDEVRITTMILLSLALGVICRNERPMAQTPKPLRSGVMIAVPVEVVSKSKSAVWFGPNRQNQG